MSRRGVVLVALVAVIAAAPTEIVDAHAALRLSDPLPGAALGDTPASIRLTLSEQPDAALSEIQVVDTAGTTYQLGRPLTPAGDLQALYIKIKPLDRGVYTVNWRVVSAVDGHATEGSYVFGVRAEPTAAVLSTAIAAVSLSEVFARSMLITGLVLMIGTAAAGAAQFGGGRELPLAGFAVLLAIAGIGFLATAQSLSAHASLVSLSRTPIGRALMWRFAGVATAAAALLFARDTPEPTSSIRRGAMGTALLAALAAVAVHVAGGHAAATDDWRLASLASQWAHFAAVGIWLGGLAALLLGVRGAPSTAKADAVRRFSAVATVALGIVAVTGATRTIGELAGWSDLASTRYGMVVLAKIVLTLGIAGLAAVNHWRSVPQAAENLGPVRRVGGAELALAACALGLASWLGALPPPAAALRSPSGLSATGVDFATTMRVRLTTPSDQPGPNRFEIHAEDYDSAEPIAARRVTLRFTPLDDPGVASTSLVLTSGPGDSYVGSGSNLAFDGRWRITALVERGGDSIQIPMEVETRTPPQFLAVARPPGEARTYRLQVEGAGHVWISPDPERSGRNSVTITCYDVIQDPKSIRDLVLTIQSGQGPVRQQSVKRVAVGTFVADVDFEASLNRLAVVARASDGTRLRAVLELTIPR